MAEQFASFKILTKSNKFPKSLFPKSNIDRSRSYQVSFVRDGLPRIRLLAQHHGDGHLLHLVLLLLFDKVRRLRQRWGGTQRQGRCIRRRRR